MSHQYSATVSWSEPGAAFTDGRYSRGHRWSFDGGIEVPASSSCQAVPLPWSREDAVDPEEALVAAVASCHLLTFLYLAAKRKWTVRSYHDEAVGIMEKNEAGKLAITRVKLRPVIAFEGAAPTRDELEAVHHLAHEECYIANSIKAAVEVEIV